MRRVNVLCSPWLLGAFLAACSGVNSSSQNGNNNSGNGSTVALALTPATATVVVSQSAAFQATVTGSTNTTVTWEVNSVVGGNATVGTIAAGVYTAPSSVPNPATVSVTAVAPGRHYSVQIRSGPRGLFQS